MTDRELLELAAKAAGIEIQRRRLDDPMWRDMLLLDREPDENAKGWNPLTDDGDALRLAAKCGMVVDIRYAFLNGPNWVSVMYWTKPGSGQTGLKVEEKAEDQLSATRRAIVRAAAEIGATL